MILFLLAYFGGVLTIVSPCILPVLPFVFARGDRPFLSSGLPMLVGMAATFAAVATLAAVGGGWAVAANQYGRLAAVALLALFGIALLFPALSERMTRPLVALGARLSATADQARRGAGFAPSGVASAGRGDRPALGPLRGTRAGAHPDGCRPSRRQCPDLAAAARLCGRGGHLAGFGSPGRRAGLRGDEALAGRRRMDPAGAWRGGAAGGCRHRLGLRHGIPHPRVARQHGLPRAGFARQVPCRPGAGGAIRRHVQRAGDDERQSGDDDVGHNGEGEARGGEPADRRRNAAPRRRGGMAELPAADEGRPQGQGRARRFLDLFLHQLPAGPSPMSGPGRRNTGIRGSS